MSVRPQRRVVSFARVKEDEDGGWKNAKEKPEEVSWSSQMASARAIATSRVVRRTPEYQGRFVSEEEQW